MHNKVGGIPVPVIGALLGIVIVAWLYFRGARGGSAPAAVTTAYPDVNTGPAAGGANVPDGTAANVPAFSTNSAWLATGVAYLITQGKGPLAAQAALSGYLSGANLTFEQGKMADAVVGRFGVPPQGNDATSHVDAYVPAVSQGTKLRFNHGNGTVTHHGNGTTGATPVQPDAPVVSSNGPGSLISVLWNVPGGHTSTTYYNDVADIEAQIKDTQAHLSRAVVNGGVDPSSGQSTASLMRNLQALRNDRMAVRAA